MTSVNFKKALLFTLKWEGGYSNHPKDPGRETNFGITQTTYDIVRKRAKLPVQSVKLITPEEVEKIYYDEYWLPTGCDVLEEKLAIAAFDWAVNSGVSRVKVYLKPGITAAQLCDQREAFYKVIGKGNLAVFLKGWLNRLNDLRSYLKL